MNWPIGLRNGILLLGIAIGTQLSAQGLAGEKLVIANDFSRLEDAPVVQEETAILQEQKYAQSSPLVNMEKELTENQFSPFVRNPEMLSEEEALQEEAEKIGLSKFVREKEPPVKVPLIWVSGDSEYRFSTRFRPEFFYGKNLRLLNSRNRTDQVAYFKHTIDLVGEYHFGKASHDYDVVMFKMDLRNRGAWGDPESISLTTESELRRLDTTSLGHRHGIPRHIIWLRELWMQISVNDMIPCFPFHNFHTFTLGAFPFELGRGISLGSAYGVGPDLLGYYAENAIDQYAFGFKFWGEIVKERLVYDLYAGIWDNKTGSFDQTNAKIRAQQIGRRFRAERGFGIINYVTAARLRWTPALRNEKYSMLLEPYLLFNDQREQKIEFVGDASSKLATAGMAGEFELGDLDFGFDTAFNFGRQLVRGLDRNIIIEQNRDGFAAIVNSRVSQIDPKTGKSAQALKIEENQEIINKSPQCQLQNKKIIGSNSFGTLVNDKHRFSDPYKVKYNGAMFVFDIGYYLCNPMLKVNAAFGYASGGENPHKDLENILENRSEFTYEGFISLLELYSGTRVKSAFLLSGQGKVPRVLSFPTEEVVDPFPSMVARFTDLMFVGVGSQFKLPDSHNKWNINPNILAYWQEVPTNLLKDKKPMQFADTFLGFEANLFAEIELLPDLRFFSVGGLFVPGKHFRDIEGIPLNRDQKKFFDLLANHDLSSEERSMIERAPILGHDIAWFINLGLEYKF